MEGEKQKKNPVDGSKALKKMIPHLLISVSLFSFLLSCSASSLSLSTFPRFNKNCLFLICNGLLVFLSNTSAFIHPRSNINARGLIKNPADQVSIFIADEQLKEEVIEKDDQNQPISCWLFQDNDDDDDDREHLFGDHDEDDDEEEMMSTEELNKKFEDFIRKMKEEIIINEASKPDKLLLLN